MRAHQALGAPDAEYTFHETGGMHDSGDGPVSDRTGLIRCLPSALGVRF